MFQFKMYMLKERVFRAQMDEAEGLVEVDFTSLWMC